MQRKSQEKWKIGRRPNITGTLSMDMNENGVGLLWGFEGALWREDGSHMASGVAKFIPDGVIYERDVTRLDGSRQSAIYRDFSSLQPSAFVSLVAIRF